MKLSKSYLIVVKDIGKNERGAMVSLCKCECGAEKQIIKANVLNGNTKSCGCKSIKHGLRNHPLYNIWSNIKARCYYVKSINFHNYGGRGVSMDSRWVNDFNAFYDWCIGNGWKKGMQVDKDIIPKKIGVPALIYSPEMCMIVTNKENCSNTRRSTKFEYLGISYTRTQLAEKFNLNQSMLRDRLVNGWTVKDAVETPVRRKQNNLAA